MKLAEMLKSSSEPLTGIPNTAPCLPSPSGFLFSEQLHRHRYYGSPFLHVIFFSAMHTKYLCSEADQAIVMISGMLRDPPYMFQATLNCQNLGVFPN